LVTLLLVAVALFIGTPRAGHAHQTIVNALTLDVRPKTESVAAVFRLNAIPMRRWLEGVSGGSVTDINRIAEYQREFTDYLLGHVSLAHDGIDCPSAGRLFVLHYEEKRDSVLATTEFGCGDKLPKALSFESRLFDSEDIAQDLIIQVENDGRRGKFILNTKGRKFVDFDLDKLTDIGAHVRDHYEAHERDFMNGSAPPQQENGTHSDGASPEVASEGGLGAGALFRKFVVDGLFHIWFGFDHLLFIFALLFAVQVLRSGIWILTAFTVGHSVSLALGTFDVFRVAPSLIEPLVALTILWVAVDNLVRRGPERQRIGVALGFGVVHGFAFSQTLWNLSVFDSVLVPLVGFNLGVELAQLAVVAPIFPLLHWFRTREPARFEWAYRGGNWLIAAAALFWLVERVAAA
jgi:hypothetical protein